ncbi:DUF31 family protein [Mycoplasma sp. 744]|uniref:MIP family Ig-specific serine endopeptidase n=1 Tax=Mycoplasma sp. 744 TaxID=3108531 RepID=UPI002B1D6515|nr:DUF31 family protein [Mycoplasma sp. 744]MEA4115715.1 DUF31 family protein [Mycoplasma sp. 744]
MYRSITSFLNKASTFIKNNKTTIAEFINLNQEFDTNIENVKNYLASLLPNNSNSDENNISKSTEKDNSNTTKEKNNNQIEFANENDLNNLKSYKNTLADYQLNEKLKENKILNEKITQALNKADNLVNSQSSKSDVVNHNQILVDLIQEADKYLQTNTNNDKKEEEKGNKPIIPTLPPNFQFIRPNVSQYHKYPDYVSKYKKVNAHEIYKEIYDRSFSIQTLFHEKSGSVDVASGQGTAWLLDYHRSKSNSNKLKLFLASNIHVLNNFANTLSEENSKKFPQYVDPTGNTLVGIALGKAANPKLETLANNTLETSGLVSYYTNSDKMTGSSNVGFGETKWRTTKTQALSNPTLIFAAIDFMKEEATAAYKEKLKTVFKEKAENYLKLNSWDTNYQTKYQNWKTQGENPNLYVDFAVFSIDIDLEKTDETFKKWINDATNALDKYLKRLADTNELPNQDKNISKYMQTLDYYSKFKNMDKKDGIYEFALSNAQDLYIAGYPRLNNVTRFSHNNPLERNNNQTNDFLPPFNERFAYGANQNSFTADAYQFRLDTAFNNLVGASYGPNYTISFSSLYYGASGSLVYNDFGQMVGIYNVISSRTQAGDLLGSSGFAPFLLSTDVSNIDNSFVTYAYNLIDSTNNSLYPKQKDSYRSNLRVMFANGFDNTNDKTTALFPEGF